MRDVVESDTKSFDVVDITSGNAIKFFENMALIFLRDADTIVGNGEDELVVADVS